MSKSTAVDAGAPPDGPRVESCAEGRFILRCPAEMAWRARTELVEALVASAGHVAPAEVILDLKGVEFLNSAGIGALFSVRRHVTDRGGQVVLCNAKPTVVRLLSTVNVPAVIPIVSDLDEAHAFFNRTGGPEQ